MEPESSSAFGICADCGKPIPSWAPSGNCPACLMGRGKVSSSPSLESQISQRERVGDWELGDKIGEGAFGIVFSVEQTKPVRRSAALKILRPGMASKEVIARFDAESQALALMNHPDVVTIYDAGITEDGRPYFAMELVPGLPVTQFAAGLSIAQKLDLFDRICAVVEHAHGRGIIHRDLKPANILVYRDDSGEPAVKLLDFGIAKATDQLLTQSTLLTGEGQLLGTPDYMSPEQTMESDIDTRADVYSLGIILYELLVGHPPFVLDSNSLDAILRFMVRIREEAAPVPSSLSQTEIAQDLDWIVGKAIEKDRERRYKTVSELRDDLKRFRRNEPIQARPPDTLYIAGKFFRRHWKLAAALITIATSITIAAIISTLMAIKVTESAQATRRAYSQSDFQTAVDYIDRDDLTHGIAHLVRSVRTAPDNPEANQLLRASLEQFPLSAQVFEKVISDQVLSSVFFTEADGSLVSVTKMGTVFFFDREGTEIAPPIAIGGTNLNAQLSPDSKLLVVTNIQGNIAVIDLEKFQLRLVDESPFSPHHLVVAIKFTPDSSQFCVASIDGTVSLWDTTSGETKWQIKLASPPNSMVFFDQGARLAIACKDGTRVDLDSLSGAETNEIAQQADPVLSLAASGSGLRYYTVSTAGVIAACDKGKPPRIFSDERVEVPLLLTAADPKRRLMAYLSAREASIWTVEGKTIINRLSLPDAPTSVAIHPTENLIAVATIESGVHLWDYQHRHLVGTQLSRAKNVEALQIDPEKEILRCVTRDGVLRHFQLPRLPVSSGDFQQLPAEWAAVPLEDRNVHFVNAKGLDLRSINEPPGSVLRAIGATPDLSRVFGAYRDGFIRVWEVASGDLLQEIAAMTKSVTCVNVSPDGNQLVYRDRFGSLAVFDLISEEKKQFVLPDRMDIGSVAFSPTGKEIATASEHGVIRIISADSGEPRTKALLHDTHGSNAPHFCRFSAGGSTLVTWGAADRAFRLWDSSTGQPITVPIIQAGIPKYAQFHEDGQFLSTVFLEEDGVLKHRVWSLPAGIPITPKIPIESIELAISSVSIPSQNPFSTTELDQIDLANGIKLGESGYTEIPIKLAR